MRTHFHIENKEFTDYIKIKADEKEYYFCDDLTIEYRDCESLDFEIEFLHAEDYFKARNPFLKLLVNLLKWILSPLMYFIDNDDGIGLEKGYDSFDPFTLKKSFSMDSPDEKTIHIRYVDPQYDKVTKKFTPPSIEFQDDSIIQKSEETAFSAAILKREWNTYHIPGWTMLMIVILLLNWLNFSVFAKWIREMPLYPMSENIGGIIGMSFSSLVTVAMFVACIVVFVKAYRLYKKVLEANL